MPGAAVWSARLDAAFDHVWRQLDRATSDPGSALRQMVVANAGPGGADARVMVLRACQRSTATLVFHTDRRMPKVAAFIAEPRVAIVGYDHAAQFQLRLRGTARIESDGPAHAAAWTVATPAARRNYMTIMPPGTHADGPTDGQPAQPDDATAQANFVRLVVALDHIEWLDLARAGHRRAAYVPQGGHWTGSWLIP